MTVDSDAMAGAIPVTTISGRNEENEYVTEVHDGHIDPANAIQIGRTNGLTGQITVKHRWRAPDGQLVPNVHDGLWKTNAGDHPVCPETSQRDGLVTRTGNVPR